MSKKKRTALLIVNPNSRMGAEADMQEGIELLKRSGMDLIQVTSHSARETAELVGQYHAEIDLVILGGGDGTISAAAEALYRHQLSFAVLPLGTANDLARSLGMSHDLLPAFDNIIENQRQRVNLGVVNGNYFLNVANIGLGVHVTHELTAEIKKKWGVFSYLKAVFSGFMSNRSFRARIVVDGQEHHLRSIHIGVGNGRYYGGGNVIEETSTIYDGLLCLYSLPPLKLWELMLLAPLLRSGRQRQYKRTFCAKGRRIEIHCSRIRDIHADGEPAGKTPAQFEVIPGALEVICPEPQPSTAPISVKPPETVTL